MSTRLVATVLVENTPTEGLLAEHGLSVHLRYQHEGQACQILLDFGQSDAFARNADRLDVDLAAVDHAILSHAHYDHADGMGTFFARNGRAPLHLSSACAEDCFSTKGGSAEAHYIGIRQGTLTCFAQRLEAVPAEHVTIAPGIHVLPHTTPGLSELGKRAGMLRRKETGFVPDAFAHDLTLILELEPGTDGQQRLAVFNSCSHAGLPVILAEVEHAFPDAGIEAYVGGLHLMRSSDREVHEAAEALRRARVGHIYTGHCTGERAFEQLSAALPARLQALRPGLVMEF